MPHKTQCDRGRATAVVQGRICRWPTHSCQHTRKIVQGTALDVAQGVGLRPERPFAGVSGPSGPEIPKKVSKRVFWGVCKEVPENTRKSRKIPDKVQIWVFFRYFSTFLVFSGTFCRPPRKICSRLFGISGPEGPEIPVNGRSGTGSRRRNEVRNLGALQIQQSL